MTRAKALLFSALFSLVAGPVQAEWQRELWDPHPDTEGQLNLPLPCGGMMAFVRIETPVDSAGPLSDHEMKIGSPNPDTGFSDFFRTTHLRGGFSSFDDDEAVLRYFYYLAKYEVTRDQWAAVMGECPEKASRGGARPQAGISWFDGIQFTRALTEWIRLNHTDALPTEDGAKGYVRLPTDAEWEFAARGGAKARDDLEFRADLPPMETDIGDYAWFQGRGSSNGSYRPIGTKLPNPLGLDGMFGGVDELILEPFRLNNLGRLHGQIGGYVTRGGSIDTPQDQLTSALRREWPFFDGGEGRANAYKTTGIRPALSVHVTTTTARTEEIRRRWLESVQAEEGNPDDPLAVLDDLSKRQTDQRLLDDLSYVRGEIVSDRRAREEAANRALRLSLMNGAVLTEWMRKTRVEISHRDRVMKTLRGMLEDTGEAMSKDEIQGMIDAHQQSRDVSQQDYDLASRIYLDTLLQLADTHPIDQIDEQADTLVIALAEREQEDLSRAIERFVIGIGLVIENPQRSREDILSDAIR